MWVDDFRELSNCQVRVRTWQGPTPVVDTVVLIHGLGGSILDWSLLAPRLARTHRVIAIDLPGFGLSGPTPDNRYGVEAQVGAVAEVIESIATPVHVIGNSMGGVDAVTLAAFSPDFIRSLTLLSPAFPDRQLRLNHIPIVLFASQRIGPSFFEWYQRMPHDKQLAAKVDVSFAGEPAPQDWLDEASDLIDRLGQSPTVATAYASAANDLLRVATDRGPDRPWELAKRLRMPVLVTHSGRDTLVNPSMRHLWAKALPESHRALFLNAGHVPQLSSPEVVERTWRGFIAAT